ncbi:MAG: guanine(37)-N1-methyltransferase [Piptocephalis tieghemiana]|nr:MAG: guanine(37)-N1-methyltransferase [Piptocephalis tieghemiana]
MSLTNSLRPPVHRALKQLDRSLFHRTLPVLAARVPTKSLGVLLKSLARDLLNIPRMRNITEDGDSKSTRLLLFRRDIHSADELGDKVRKSIHEVGGQYLSHTISLDYAFWSADEILRSILPEGMEVPTSFETIGHIAHMNLRDEHQAYKSIIGQVILDKNIRIRTVVNKTDNIDTTFRFFKMEVLAGEDDMIAEVKESGCRFRMDFSNVYWNSRLHTEHDRMIRQFDAGHRICDVFAGIGPFAIPAARKGCIVHANDLNPVSYKYLKENSDLNKVPKGRLIPYNLDGREFIRKAFLDPSSDSSTKTTFDHVVMNLPAIATEFLGAKDAFNGLLKHQEPPSSDTPLPWVHCHCFAKRQEEGPLADVVKRISISLGHPMTSKDISLHYVRSVAPNKDMYCASFRLTREILYHETNSSLEGISKRKGVDQGGGVEEESQLTKHLKVE